MKRKTKIILGILGVITLLVINQIYYLCSLQFKCTEKINNGKDLTRYEIFSAMQTHTNFWLFGWVIEPNTALACFQKQFNMHNPILMPSLPEDEQVRKARLEAYNHPGKKVRMAWKSYNTKASIYLNGSYIYLYDDGDDDCTLVFNYDIPLDYKPGIIKINGITLCETVFDYLENIGKLKVFTINRVDPYRADIMIKASSL